MTMRRALADIAIILALAGVAWLAYDYSVVRQRAANGQAAADYIANALKAQEQAKAAPK